MDRNNPQLESIPRFTPLTDTADVPAWHQSARARLFAVTFIVTLAAGVAWTLLQPTIYRSSATVLMSAPSAIDSAIAEANVQSVAIQRRILLGGEVTSALLAELNDFLYAEFDTNYLREVLQVNPVPDTNLVEMTAEGADVSILPTLVNTWIDVYFKIRANEVQRNQQQTLDVVETQLRELGSKVEAARATLAQYRDDNNIISSERLENEELAKLDGLNDALNKAVEAEVNARARMDSLNKAVASGKNVVPPSDRKSVEEMYSELTQLQNTLKKLSKTYTLEFIQNHPTWRDIPERIEVLEERLAEIVNEGQEQLVGEAQRDHSAALSAVESLQEKLEQQKVKAAKFTTIYATHKALMEDLENLEALNRETQARLTQVEVNQVEKYPQVSVIDRPGEDSVRVGPDLALWLGSSLAAAFGAGILSVWLYGFLGHRVAKPAFVTLSGVHMYPQDPQNQLAYMSQQNVALGQATTNLLSRDDDGASSSTTGNNGSAPAQDNDGTAEHSDNKNS